MTDSFRDPINFPLMDLVDLCFIFLFFKLKWGFSCPYYHFTAGFIIVSTLDVLYAKYSVCSTL